jgi:drug/metabolite transporter (DMT)-like permease
MVVAAGTLFAANGTVAKLVLTAGISPTHLTTLRATGAFAVLLVLLLVRRARRATVRWPQRATVRPRDLVTLAIYGLTGFFLVPLLYLVAISRIPVGIGLLLEFTGPLLVAIWARFGQRQPVRPRLWIGLALSLAGLACVVEAWGRLVLDPIGVAAALAAAVGLATYFVVGARGVASRDTLSLTCWAFGTAALAGAVVRPWWGFPFDRLVTRVDGVPVWLLCCHVVLLGSVVPYLLVTGSLRYLPATSAGIIGMVEPVIAATVAWLVLGEALRVPQVIGGLLVLTGVTLAETARLAPLAGTRPPVAAEPVDRPVTATDRAQRRGPPDERVPTPPVPPS